MSFCCFVPGKPYIAAQAFTRVSETKWSVEISSETPVNELAAFITEPLAAGTALALHIASAPFEAGSWHYLGAITNLSPSAIFKLAHVWSARDAVPTVVQFGVELQSEQNLQHTPPEKISAEVLEVGRRIGQDLFQYLSSFAVSVHTGDGEVIQLPKNALERWLARFIERCRTRGLDWLTASAS